MKIVALNNARNGKADRVASKLASNSDVVYVKPYTDKPPKLDFGEDYIHLNDKQLSDKMEREIVAVTCEVGKYRYTYFENQFTNGFVVLILDDDCIKTLKKKYGDDVITIRVKSKDEEVSSRMGNLRDGFFDFVFDYDVEDVDDLEWRVSYECDKA